ncbi:MAG: hypothetical protein ABS75_16375 [Pelagibacterium sp. SCN 63-23]|nr:MAG: hypothetical protein ABS75_16375 [Pelagibacterium sp. SCN 63-23]
MHVLVLPSWYPQSADDPAGSFFREQALAVHRQGCRVGVIALKPISLRNWRYIVRGQYVNDIEIDQGLPTWRQEFVSWFPRLPNQTAALWRWHGMSVFRKYQDVYGKPDIVHVHSALYAACIAKEIFFKYRIPYVVSEHSSAFVRNLIRGATLSVATDAVKSANKRFSVSRAFSKKLSSVYEDSNACIWQTMPNGVSDEFLSTKINWEDRGKYTFSHLSIFNDNKKIDNIIRSFAIKFKGNKSVDLKIGGDGVARKNLEDLAVEVGVSSQVHFVGPISRRDAPSFIASSDAFVLGSEHETFGVVLIEAMAAGKPVVATQCGGPDDIVTEQTGLLVPVNDIDALAEAMASVYRNRDRYDPNELRESCRRRYSQQSLATKWLDIYSEVLGRPLPSSFAT